MVKNPLGQSTEYPSHYDPKLLFPIPRIDNRQRLGVDAQSLPFKGYDAWRAYEISWLSPKGKPVQAIGEFIVPADSTYMVESKSLKLYLNSLNQTELKSMGEAQESIARDLSHITAANVLVQLFELDSASLVPITLPAGICLDDLDIEAREYSPSPDLLSSDASRRVEESLYSNVFRSNCPVTQQPDWGTVEISYKGAMIDHAALLRYLVSFRQHEGFHEDCAEQIYLDIAQRCEPTALNVSINFLRRGGIEINPVRGNGLIDVDFPAPRFARQ
jgi:7-cyano-7-deazaguanine reductase